MAGGRLAGPELPLPLEFCKLRLLCEDFIAPLLHLAGRLGPSQGLDQRAILERPIAARGAVSGSGSQRRSVAAS